MKTKNKILEKNLKGNRPPSFLDDRAGWLTLLAAVAILGGLAYGGWAFFSRGPQSEPKELDDTTNIDDPLGFLDHKPSEKMAIEETEDSPAPKLNSSAPPGPAPEGMVWVPGGEFYMGISVNALLHMQKKLGWNLSPFLDASYCHMVYVDGFWMDSHEVTNEEFQRFVEETKYVTLAEKPQAPGDLALYKVPDKKLLTDPWSFCFRSPSEDINPWEYKFSVWWEPTFGATWKHPEGPDSTIKDRAKHPVVHISWEDAQAYCKWAKKRLPTEAEWEFACRGGLDRKVFMWGDEKNPGGKPGANYWQGVFPNKNTREDGFLGTAPVGSFPPNAFGLHDMAGNAWEWCQDYYDPNYYLDSVYKNPQGPLISADAKERSVPFRVLRGGSFLCGENYCQKFQPGARHKGEQNASWNHAGFRCVCDEKATNLK